MSYSGLTSGWCRKYSIYGVIEPVFAAHVPWGYRCSKWWCLGNSHSDTRGSRDASLRLEIVWQNDLKHIPCIISTIVVLENIAFTGCSKSSGRCRQTVGKCARDGKCLTGRAINWRCLNLKLIRSSKLAGGYRTFSIPDWVPSLEFWILCSCRCLGITKIYLAASHLSHASPIRDSFSRK